jgi:pilus assembly protein CpaF
MKDDSQGRRQQAHWTQESGPLRLLIMDPNISEIMVNSHDKIFVEKAGVIEPANVQFKNVDELIRFVNSIAVFTGKELNRKNPYIDARLPDGSRVNIVIGPAAVDGASVTIRKFSDRLVNYDNLVKSQFANEKVIYFLNQAVNARQNIIVSGGTGTGKTTLLNILSSFIPETHRVVTVEGTVELKLSVKNLVRLEASDSMGNDAGISIQDLITNALRMRPDRIIVGECRGDEAWDMLLAMNTGHEGSMTTLHANSAYDTLRRLEAMVLRSGVQAPLSMVKSDIANTIDLIVHTIRDANGVRRISEIAEVCALPDGGYNVNNIFEWHPMKGFVSTGATPRFARDLSSDVIFPDAFFNPAFKMSFKPNKAG